MYCLVLPQKFEEALEAYGEAISLDSTNMSFFSNRAAVYFEQKDYEGCIAEVSELSCRPSRSLADTKYCKRNVP